MEQLSPDSSDSHAAADVRRRLEEMKRHIVQLEGITLATILFVSIAYFQPAVAALLGSDVALLLPFALLAAVAWLVPVINPEDRIRARIKWALAGLGAGATAGGIAAGVLSLGVATPVGAAIGGGIGLVTGFVSGPAMDGTAADVMTQGAARDYLMTKRKKYPDLDHRIILDVTEYPPKGPFPPIPMYLSDGVIKCAKLDVDEWLSKKNWRR